MQATFGFGIQPALGRCFWNPTVLTFGFGIQPAVGSCFWNPAVLSGLSWNPNTLLPVQLESNYDFVKYVYCQLDPVPGIRHRGMLGLQRGARQAIGDDGGNYRD